MNTAKQIGRSGALAVALGAGTVRRHATRAAASIFAGALVVTAAVTAAPISAESPTVKLSADSAEMPPLTALLVCGAACPTFHDADVDVVMDQFITPTHPGQIITPVAVTTPSEIWPVTGVLRLIGFVTGDPRLFGPGGAGWPDEPWWELSGLFDLTANQSLQTGVAELEEAMAAHGNDHLVIYGYSMGAGVVNLEKNKLAAQYPKGTPAPDITFVLGGDPTLPNGGMMARIPGLYIPILDFPAGFAASTDTQFKTVEINQQYDGAADFPLYPLNAIALLNAGLGFLYLHTYPFDVSLPDNPKTSPAYQGTYGDTDYYFFETQDLPLFAPLRQIGVPESVIDVVEPFFRVLVELGYDRSIDPWAPTPARLIPTNLDPAEVVTDLVNAIGEGATNAAALVGAPAPSISSTDADDTALAQVTAEPGTAIAAISAKAGSPEPQGDLTESTNPDEVKVSNEGSVQQDAVETSTDGAKFEPSVQDERKASARNSAVKHPQLFGCPTSQKLVDRGLAGWEQTTWPRIARTPGVLLDPMESQRPKPDRP